MLKLPTIFGLIAVSLLVLFVQADDQFSAQETEALQKLKATAGDILNNDYFKEDYMLVNFLRDKELDVPATIAQLKETAAWRKTNKIDGPENAKLDPELNKELEWDTRGVDKQGRVVATIAPGVWDDKKAITESDPITLELSWAPFTEDAYRMVKKYRVEGKNVTQCHMLINLGKFDVNQHDCIKCVPTFIQWTKDWQTNWPHLFYRFTFVNTPQVLADRINLVKPFFSPYVKTIIQVLGTDFKEELLKTIDVSQLLTSYGGTMVIVQ